MARDPDRQMTIPELLEARAVIRRRLEKGTGAGALNQGLGNPAALNGLLAELREIEAELAEQGYKGA